MGSNQSQEKEPKRTAYDVKRMYYDEDGNVRFGNDVKGRREDELRRVVDADTTGMEGQAEAKEALEVEEKEEDVTWYVIDAQWLKLWLAYVHYAKSTPRPPPSLFFFLLFSMSSSSLFFSRQQQAREGRP